ncbi:exopolyphosphatase-like enzyme [Desulfosporosinus acidiphilus SJ4]|uniref:Exopolyphosphatase-like enzyme n=1 Tax=Desulfosporosinus acidiphilus (strain DSM 22704 / JCM 16185 / SJ4) TaxID=646529 RepID=I4D9E9_DESAJ|nr:bifunctional oligoribonuclease/PAP phosphatase NrnA [Desulfosporosinus acidiphilus]AFM42423.1 exopolyphosphatase-like enzyme [Desulfosporosinus acidiphilus SJ4]
MTEHSLTKEIIEVLRKAPSVALFSHVSPDGDCLGSMLALGLALETMGKKVAFFNPDRVPEALTFLPGSDRIQQLLPNPLPEVLVFTDCTDLKRVTLTPGNLGDSIVVNIDHHISNQRFGKFNWVDDKASACAEVCLTLIKQLGVLMDKDIATNLYTGIVTDSGCFQYSNTTANTHRLTAELIETGLDLTMIHHHLFDQKPLAQVKLLQAALNTLELYADGQLAVMTLTLEDFRQSGAVQEHSEGLVNHARSIQGVEAAVLLKEVGPQEIKGGFRSNLWFDVNKVAAQFGGGGHKRAAGCTMKVSLTEAKKQVIRAIEEGLIVGRAH